MELKLPLPSPKRELPVLLIVPYGIETGGRGAHERSVTAF